MRLWSREPDEDPRIDSILILLDTLDPAERRDLATALLRAAWSASLEETRVLLLDVVTATDAAAMWEAGG
jgi:hypothetical protein